jgi:hypothetical protein
MRTRTVVRNGALDTALVVTTLLTATPLAGIAQAPSAVTPAPVPTQIISARRAFVSNAGSDSYGPAVYYELTKYDGGPDRLYNSFYAALKQWGRLELLSEPAQADLVYAVRFASPAVARRDSAELVYDSQISVTIIDPATRVTLWSITEHVEPARRRAVANDNFDRAVLRLVDRTRLLIESPNDAARVAAAAPAGARRQFELRQRKRNSAIGAVLGFTLAAAYQTHALKRTCQPTSPPTSCSPEGPINRGLVANVAGAGAGAVIGWLLPVRRP